MKKTLFVLAHQDDEALSCGALILSRLSHGGEVSLLTLFSRKYHYGSGNQYGQEQMDAYYSSIRELTPLGSRELEARFLGFEEGEPFKQRYYEVLEAIESKLTEYQPDSVVIPCMSDMNQDHRWLGDCSRIALRPSNLGTVQQVLVSYGLDGRLGAEMNWFLPVSLDMLEQKLRAVSCYERESRKVPHSRSRENLIAYHRLAGSLCGEEYAEPYTLLMQRGL